MYNDFIKIIADNTDSYTIDDIKPESRFYEDLEMNSMDIINMTIDLEAFFKVKMNEKAFKDIHTVAELKAYIEKLSKKAMA